MVWGGAVLLFWVVWGGFVGWLCEGLDVLSGFGWLGVVSVRI